METIKIDLTHEDAVRLVRSIPIMEIPPREELVLEKIRLIVVVRQFDHQRLWAPLNSVVWHNFTTMHLYETYLMIKRLLNNETTMNKEILRENIRGVLMQPCLKNPYMYPSSKRDIKKHGLSEDGTYFIMKVTPDDTSVTCFVFDNDGNEVDFVGKILGLMPEKYRDHLVTIKHDRWLSYSYEPVFDTDTQEKWDDELDTFLSAKLSWCDKFGCD